MSRILFLTLFISLLINSAFLFAQKEEMRFSTDDIIVSKEINPLAPATASFYSAILPGLGQAYNKSYWKIPLVYAALGTCMYYYVDSDNKYNDYRDAYKRRLAGYTDDKYPFFSDTSLISAQKFYQRNRDLSALLFVGFYILNIIDAHVDASLKQFNVDDNLSFEPKIKVENNRLDANFGFSINYNF